MVILPSPSTMNTTSSAASVASHSRFPQPLPYSPPTRIKPHMQKSQRTTGSTRPYSRNSSCGTMRVPSFTLPSSQRKAQPSHKFWNLALLTHLHDTYGQITEKELEQNVQRIQTQWKPPTAIESLFVQIEDGVAFTIEGQDEPTKSAILRWAYEIISQTGRFEIACREWLQMDATTKNMGSIQISFQGGRQRYAIRGHHRDHMLPRAPMYMTENSAVARETDLLARLAASKQALARALSQASIAPTVNTAANISTITPNPPRAYCWTHGFCKNINHTCTSCLYPGEGHQVDATASNMMGGTTTNFVSNSCLHRS
jgi:hypothetical protein